MNHALQVRINGINVFAGSEMDCYQLLYLIIGEPTAELLSSENTPRLIKISEMNRPYTEEIEIHDLGNRIVAYTKALNLKEQDEIDNARQGVFIRQR
jgi:hypothetical protein